MQVFTRSYELPTAGESNSESAELSSSLPSSSSSFVCLVTTQLREHAISIRYEVYALEDLSEICLLDWIVGSTVVFTQV